MAAGRISFPVRVVDGDEFGGHTPTANRTHLGSPYPNCRASGACSTHGKLAHVAQAARAILTRSSKPLAP